MFCTRGIGRFGDRTRSSSDIIQRMDFDLPPALGKFVADQVSSGRFQSPDEVIVAALEHWRDQEELTAADVEELRRELSIGVDQSRRGESTPLDMSAIR